MHGVRVSSSSPGHVAPALTFISTATATPYWTYSTWRGGGRLESGAVSAAGARGSDGGSDPGPLEPEDDVCPVAGSGPVCARASAGMTAIRIEAARARPMGGQEGTVDN
jgi:hypothetical protein